MAIRKDDVARSVSLQVRRFCDDAEVVIDEKLVYFLEGDTITVSFSEIDLTGDLPGYGQIQKELIRRYTEAGWTVTTHSDQRDGSWFAFK